MHLTRLALALATIAVFMAAFAAADASAHQNGCHRWHSCPSDTGS